MSKTGKHQTVSVRGSGRVALVGTLTINLTHKPEGELYRIAREHAQSARALHDEGKHFPGELYESLQAVILAAAALEAFINGQSQAAYGTEWQKYEDGQLAESTRRPDLLGKWYDVPQKLNDGNPVFEKGKEPFQGLKRIDHLRNYALHYKPIPQPPKSSLHGNVSELASYFDYQAARRSIDSMHKMLSYFQKSLKMPYPDWLGTT